MNEASNQEEASENKPAKPMLFCQDVVLDFAEISGGRPEILIEYRGQRYRLRATKNGKLILNK